ncbi:MAG: S-layer homology domain-containing protein [Clostridiales bacterium]|nr:S-layer homology domain-containing protein [Clostridiales bacterium]
MKNIFSRIPHKRLTAMILAICLAVTVIPLSLRAQTSYLEEEIIPFLGIETVAAPSAIKSPFSGEEGVKRSSVLVLDISSSMDGTPLKNAKKAAIEFCKGIVSEDGENVVAVIAFNDSATLAVEYTTDLALLKKGINALTASGGSNLELALTYAKWTLELIDDENAIENVILFSDGLPSSSVSAPYLDDLAYSESSDGRNGFYSQNANPAAVLAESMQNDGISIYTLGFFTRIDDTVIRGFAGSLMQEMQNSGFYDIADADSLLFGFGEVVQSAVSKRSGKFAFPTGNLEDAEATYYYDDAYFEQSANNYDPKLATMSLCLEMSAMSSNYADYPDKSQNAQDLLGQIGFKGIEPNEAFTVKPTYDSIGAVAAYKNILSNGKTFTVVTLAMRGGGYEDEWASNMEIGKTGNHAGFQSAANQVHAFLSDYIERHKEEFSEQVKLWIVGYSRGGITTNILASTIGDNGGIASLKLSKTNIFAYCFEPPLGLQIFATGLHPNIHNIINPNDIVTKVAPKVWGFTRAGTDNKVIPTASTSWNYKSQAAKMTEKFKELDTPFVRLSLKDGKHMLESFQAKKLGLKLFSLSIVQNDNKAMSAFLDDFITCLALGGKGRSNYTDNLEGLFQRMAIEFMSHPDYMGNSPETYDRLVKFLDLSVKAVEDNLVSIILTYVTSGKNNTVTYISDILMECADEAGSGIFMSGNVPTALGELFDTMVRMVLLSIINSGFDDLLTLLYNLDSLVPAHYPELCLAWLMSQDPNYTSGAQDIFAISSYRVVRINCPVDVDVFDSSGNLVARIIDDVVQEVEGSSIIAEFNSDGEKVIYLPADETYETKIVATEAGTLNYSVGEFSYDSMANAKLVNYYDIPITEGATFSGEIPQFSESDAESTGEGSSVDYSLEGAFSAISPTTMLSGEAAQEAVYTIQLETDNELGGTVNGGGSYTEGEFCVASAIPFDGCEFDGWYESGTLASTDLEYRFRVTKETTLTASFSGERPTEDTGNYTLSVTAGSGGTITFGEDMKLFKGSSVPLVAEPESGYRFSKWISSNGGTFENPYDAFTNFTMPSRDTTVTATFELPQDYSLSVSSTSGGSVTQGSSAKYLSGTDISLEATPSTGYRFARWETSNGGYFEDPESFATVFAMPSVDTTVTAVFEKAEKHDFAISATAGGLVTLGDNGPADAAELISIAAEPLAGYIFKTWISSNGGSFEDETNSQTTFSMPDNNVSVTAIFEPIATNQLTLTSTAGGHVTLGESGSYKEGERVAISAVAQSGYRFKSWTSTSGGRFADASSDSTYFEMPGNGTTVIANFESDKETPTPKKTATPKATASPKATATPKATASPSPNATSGKSPTQAPSPLSQDKPSLDKTRLDGYINGYPNGTFMPSKQITRYEAASLFNAISAGEWNEAPSSLIDVPAGQWYSNAVGFLTSSGIVSGYPDKTFRGENLITRAEFAAIASKFEAAADSGTLAFTDVNSGHWAYPAIKSAFGHGWISGYSDGSFKPDANITRAEAVIVLNRMLGWDAASSALGSSKAFTDLQGNEWFYKDVIFAANGKS